MITEEVAHLLIYGCLPTAEGVAMYRGKLRELRTLPKALTTILELLPAEADPMDVLRTAISVLGSLEPETNTIVTRKKDQPANG